ncbi:MAG: hypothetical protein LBC33_03310 [Mycoplasmataceae bacterium]|nr:hypothetical protein [Mycoplasmataceae bacterium]
MGVVLNDLVFEINFTTLIALIPFYAPLILLFLLFINIWLKSSVLTLIAIILVLVLFGAYFIDLLVQYDWDFQKVLNGIWSFFRQ